MHTLWMVVEAVLPTTGVAVLFYFVIKALVEGDRRERLAHSQWEAGQAQQRQAEVAADAQPVARDASAAGPSA